MIEVLKNLAYFIGYFFKWIFDMIIGLIDAMDIGQWIIVGIIGLVGILFGKTKYRGRH